MVVGGVLVVLVVEEVEDVAAAVDDVAVIVDEVTVELDVDDVLTVDDVVLVVVAATTTTFTKRSIGLLLASGAVNRIRP
jgi:hypothetical protein